MPDMPERGRFPDITSKEVSRTLNEVMFFLADHATPKGVSDRQLAQQFPDHPDVAISVLSALHSLHSQDLVTVILQDRNPTVRNFDRNYALSVYGERYVDSVRGQLAPVIEYQATLEILQRAKSGVEDIRAEKIDGIGPSRMLHLLGTLSAAGQVESNTRRHNDPATKITANITPQGLSTLQRLIPNPAS